MSKKREQLIEQIFDAMNASQRLMKAQFLMSFSKLNLSPAQTHVLVTLQDSQPVSLKDLAARLYMTPSAVTQFVDALEKLGYVERTGQADDRRVVCVALSARGKEVMKRVNDWREAMMTNIMATFDDDELEMVTRLQTKIREYLEAYICPDTKKGEHPNGT
jgi:DNA-binding MarR family transcriptional regulator